MGERMFFRDAYLSVLLLRSCIRIGSNFLFFLAFGFLKLFSIIFSLYFWCLRRPRRARGIASSPYALLGFSYYPFVTPGTACQGAVTAMGYVRSCYPFLVGGFTMQPLIWLPCSLA